MKVLLADDHGLFREGFALVIRALFPAVQIKQVNCWQAVHQKFPQEKWDLIILDLFMPGQERWEQELEKLFANAPYPLNVCVVSASTSPQNIQLTFQLGVKGYLSKVSDLDEVNTALKKILAGGIYMPPNFWHIQPAVPQARGRSITERQQEILNLIASGRSNKQIAAQLGLTESTIKRHVYNIFKILDANNRVEAIDFARQRGLLYG